MADHGPRGLQRLVGPARGVGLHRALAPPVGMATLLRQLPDRPAVEVVMEMAGYRTPVYRLGKMLAQQRRALEQLWQTKTPSG